KDAWEMKTLAGSLNRTSGHAGGLPYSPIVQSRLSLSFIEPGKGRTPPAETMGETLDYSRPNPNSNPIFDGGNRIPPGKFLMPAALTARRNPKIAAAYLPSTPAVACAREFPTGLPGSPL